MSFAGVVPFGDEDFGSGVGCEDRVAAIRAGGDEVDRVLDPDALEASQVLVHEGCCT
jgi:hypothetical protein